jgi:hypothetical protein
MADGSGRKSDPPVGTGRGMKPRGEKAATRGRSEIPGGLVFVVEPNGRNVSNGHLVKKLYEIRVIDS